MGGKQWDQPPEMQIDASKTYKLVIESGKGNIELELNPQQAPKTVNNFVFLAREARKDSQGGCAVNIVLWVVQILLALAYGGAAYQHSFGAAQTKLRPGYEWMSEVPQALLIVVAICEFLGAAAR